MARYRLLIILCKYDRGSSGAAGNKMARPCKSVNVPAEMSENASCWTFVKTMYHNDV